jgi:gas vesicle protein
MGRIFWILLISVPASGHAAGFDDILRDPLTLVFIGLIVSATVFFSVIRYDRFAILHGPEILTTLGIFGCFVGIALALLDFDAKNINVSVPLLLSGVKTAFWASVCGVGGALVIKLRQRFSRSPIPLADGEPKAASLEDVVHSIGLLRKSITGEGDSSLINQLKLMRSEQSEASRALRNSLDDFAEKVSELGSRALIEALEKVIKDFNTQLNEQFGENFKQLNLAVEKLVIWQQQYKDELTNLQEVQKKTASDLRLSAEAFGKTAEKAEVYTKSADSLRALLADFDKQYALMRTSQESLSEVLGALKEVEPEFSSRLEDLTKVFKDGVKTTNDEVQKHIGTVTSHINQLTTDFSNNIKQHMEAFEKIAKESIPQIQQGINAEIANTNKQLASNFETLDKNLEQELEKALATMGRQLASLSEKFVKDYTPLTDRLKEIVELSRGK